METTQLPHLGLRAAKKLNPKLQCWRWNEGFTCFNTFEPGCWVPVGTPKWLPHCIYAVTGSKKEKPSWAPSPQQLKDASSLIADAPLKLWLKLLDFETLEVLHNRSVAASAKAKLLGQRDETAYRVNRIREATHRELEYRRTKPPTGEGPALGSQAQQSGTERLHRAVPKSRRQTRSQPVER